MKYYLIFKKLTKKIIRNFTKVIFPWRNLSKKTRKRVVFASIAIILILAPVVIYTLENATQSEAAWFNDSWGFRKAIPVTSTEGAVQNNVFVSFTLDTATLITAGKMQSNCNDIRITDVNGKLLKYHIGRVNACNNATTTIDTLLSSFPNGQSTYYIYYGNPSAPAVDAGSLTVSQANSSTVTASGNEITDVTRATATQGDGLYPSATNLVTNGGFESNTTGWSTITANISRITTTSKFGNGSLQIIPTAQFGRAVSSSISVTPGASYTLSFYAKVTGGTMIPEVSGNVAPYYWSGGNLSPSSWTRYTMTVTIGTDTSVNVWFLTNDAGPSFPTIQIDGVQLETGSVATDYIDTNGSIASRYPDSSYGIWQGATNLIANGGLETDATGWVGHGNAAISQSNTYSKFGSKSLKVISGDTGANGARFPVSISNSTTYSMGVWVYSPDAGNMDIAIWRNDFGAYVGSNTVNVSANTWTYISGTGTTDGVSPWATLLVRNLNGAIRTFYVDGLQLESGSTSTPYIETNGSTSARSAASVLTPSSILNSTQGWVAVRYRLPRSTPQTTSYGRIFEWGTINNNAIYLSWSGSGASNQPFTITRETTTLVGTALSPTISDVSAGSIVTLIFAWDKNNIKLSYNGGAFSSMADAVIPDMSAYSTISIGSDYGGTYAGGSYLWFASGKGILTDSDASTINGYGNTDPSSTQLAALNNGLGTSTLLWTADTTANTQTAYSQGPARNYTIGTLASEENGAAPVAYWKFDEGQGNSAKDSSSNQLNGTITGAAWQTENMCANGKCLKFNGSGDYVNVHNVPDSVFGGNFTVSAWVKFNTVNKGTDNAILGHGTTTVDKGLHLGERSGKAYMGFYGDDLAGNTTFSTNTWYFVTFVYDGGKKIYINGVLDNSGTSNPYTGTGSNAEIGRYPWATSYLMNGFVDEPKIYSYARSASQIKTDYSSRGSVKGVSTSIGASSANQNLSNGLVGFWKMDESSWNGTTGEVVDSSGNANNGTEANGANTTTEKFGNGGTFDGSNDYVSVPNSSNLQITGSITISAWIKANSVSGRQVLLEKYGSYGIKLESGQLVGYRWGGSENHASSTLSTGTWYFVTMTFDGLIHKTYVNGTLVNSESDSGSIPSTTNVVGIGASATSGNYFNGLIDEARVYNRALSPVEVSQLYNYAPSPVAYWNFEEGSGGSVNDTSGNGNTGTWNGTGSHWTQGKYGKAGNFNGVDDFVNIPNSSFLNPNILTVSTWAKSNTSTWNDYGFLVSKRDVYVIHPNQGVTTVTFYINNGSWVGVTCTPPSSITNWHYYTLTWDGTNLSCYIDGILGSSSTPGGSINTSDTGPLNIGRDDGLSRYLNGKIDEVRIYNYARTQGQIIQDMNGGHPLGGSPVASQIGYYKFDEGYGTTANNSGNGGPALNGTLNGTVWSNDGKFGKALLFNGVTSYVNIPQPTQFSRNSFTNSFWLNISNSALTQTVLSEGAWGAGSRGWGIGFYAADTWWGAKTGYINFSYQFVGGGTIAIAKCNYAGYQNKWAHITAVRDFSAQTIALYLNGIKCESNYYSNMQSTETNDFQTSLKIGEDSWTSANYLSGTVDEIKVYSTALTADEVKLDYNHGATQVLGSMSDTSGLSGGSVASNSASAAYCIPGDTSTCSSPVGEWNFEEGNGNSVNDTSGNGNTGIWNGTFGSQWKQGKVGKGGNFNGSDNYVNTPSIVTTQTQNVTAEGWVYWRGSTSAPKAIIYNGASGSNGWGLLLSNGACGAGNKIGILLGAAACDTTSSTTTLPVNTWTHLTITRGASIWTLYVNGQPKETGSGTPNTPGTSTNFGGETGGGGKFDGIIDQVRIFNYARTRAQIAYDYNRGAPVAYWKLDECQGTIVRDSSGNGNDGTITIGATGSQTTAGTCLTPTDGTGAWYNGASGKFNASLKFDSADDYVSIPYNAILDQINTVTLSAWIKYTTTANTVVIEKSNNNTHYQFQVFDSTQGSMLGGELVFMLQPNSSNWVVAKQRSNDGQWHHVVGTYDRTINTAKIYIDGVLRNTNNNITTGPTSNASPLLMGSRSGVGGFGGSIDDVRIYNYVLTPTQVKQVMNQGSGVRFGPLTGSP
jgi:hypothetical protein